MATRVRIISLLLICLAMIYSDAGAQNLLNNPESVVYDAPRDRYLVSNWGDGAIVAIDNSGAQSYFSTFLQNQCRLIGIHIKGDTLLAAAGDSPTAGLFGFDLATGVIVMFVALPGVGLPNDIAVDNAGIIYVTDYWGDKLYKIENGSPSVYLGTGLLDYPNGLVYDDRYNRLLIASVMGTNSPILAVSLDDTTITTVVTTGLYGTDGITFDADYRCYVTDGLTDAVYRYDPEFSNPIELFSTGHESPADIYYDRVNTLLAVPNLDRNTVDFIPVDVPDGGGTGRIAYTYQPMYGPAVHEIYMINMDGTENTKISDAPIGVNHHDWSPTGHKLAAVGYVDPPNTWSIFVFEVGGTNWERLTTTVNVWDNEPSWSPDGSRIAFGRIYPADNFREEVWVMDADGIGQHWIGVYGENPTWSPDGTRLVYHSSRSGTYDIYTCNADGSAEQQLTFTTAYNEVAPDWSPDSSRIVYYGDLDGDHEIYVMDPDGGNPLQLTHNSVGDFQPNWSPDGSLITFGSGMPGNDHWEVYIMNANGTNIRRVTYTPLTATAINPCWQPLDSTEVAVYLAHFVCARTEGGVKLTWAVQDDASAAEFRLVAGKDGRQRDIPVRATGARRFEAFDQDPSLKTGGIVTYTLFGRGDDWEWSILRSEEVRLGTPAVGPMLRDVYPNPFNPRTTVSFTLNIRQHVRLEVYDAAGRLVTTLAEQKFPAGEHDVIWDGRNSAGGKVSSGVYFVKFTAGKTSDSRKLVLVK